METKVKKQPEPSNHEVLAAVQGLRVDMVQGFKSTKEELRGEIAKSAQETKDELRAEIAKSAKELRGEIAKSAKDLRGEIAKSAQETKDGLRGEIVKSAQETKESLRGEFKKGFAEFKSDLEGQIGDLAIATMKGFEEARLDREEIKKGLGRVQEDLISYRFNDIKGMATLTEILVKKKTLTSKEANKVLSYY